MSKSKKTKTVKMCPKCHSKNLTIYMGATTGMRYRCKDCGYIGVLVIEEEVKKRWFCPVCKKFVNEVYIDYLKGFTRVCKKCGSVLMELNDLNKKDFKKLTENFKKKTGKIN